MRSRVEREKPASEGKKLLSDSALARLLYNWQADGGGNRSSMEVCQRLVQLPGFRSPLEYVVLHTAAGEKSHDMRLNLRLFDKNASISDEKIFAQKERLDARRAELRHLIDETRKGVQRATSESKEARLEADEAAAELAFQRKRLAALRSQKLAFEAICSHNDRQRESFRTSSISASLFKEPPLRNPDHPVVADVLQKLRRLLGEGGATQVQNITNPLASVPAPAQNSLKDLNKIPVTEGRSILSALQKQVELAINELKTMGGDEAPLFDTSAGVSDLRILTKTGQESHMKMFIEQEEIKNTAANYRTEASAVCQKILERLDHQSTLVRQLTEAQARTQGTEAQKKIIEQHLQQISSTGRSHKSRAIVEKRPIVEGLRMKRDERISLISKLTSLMSAAENPEELPPTLAITGKSDVSPKRLGRISLGAHSDLVKESLLGIQSLPHNDVQELSDALPGTGSQILSGIEQSTTDHSASDPTSLQYCLLRLRQAFSKRQILREKLLFHNTTMASKNSLRDDVASHIAEGIRNWQECVSKFTHVVHGIKECQDFLQSLDGDFDKLIEVSKDLHSQPASKIPHILERYQQH